MVSADSDFSGFKSKDTIPKSVDRALDKSFPSGNGLKPGISIANGPVTEMDIDEQPVNGVQTNGAVIGKRKSRASLGNAAKSYKEATDDEDDQPLVRSNPGRDDLGRVSELISSRASANARSLQRNRKPLTQIPMRLPSCRKSLSNVALLFL